MQMAQPTGRVSYEPSTLSETSPRENPTTGFRSIAATEAGPKGRIRAQSFADHYSQARQFYQSQSVFEQAHIGSAFVFELSKVDHLHVREAMVAHLRHVNEDLARRVGFGLGFERLPDAPAAAAPVQEMPASPALQIIGKMKATLKGRTIGILVAPGSDGTAVKKLRTTAIDAGASLKIVALRLGGIQLDDGTRLVVDGQLAGTPSVLFDAIAIVLSPEEAKALWMESAAIDFVRDAFHHLKAILVDQGGQSLLEKANIPSDAGIFGSGDVERFAVAAQTRQWAREKSVRTLA
jgi:catalase